MMNLHSWTTLGIVALYYIPVRIGILETTYFIQKHLPPNARRTRLLALAWLGLLCPPCTLAAYLLAKRLVPKTTESTPYGALKALVADLDAGRITLETFYERKKAILAPLQ